MMNEFPVIPFMNAVEPVTIGELYNDLHEGSYGYTPAVLDFIFSTFKLDPRQHVSAFVSISLMEMFPGSGSSIL